MDQSEPNKDSGTSNLPNPKLLKWAHSTCSRSDLHAALIDESITAIEADIVWGHEENKEKEVSPTPKPIMAHPPKFISDLSFEIFIETALANTSVNFECKHLKLDFKDAETVDPVLKTLKASLPTSSIANNYGDHGASNTNFDRTIFLNADILAGPGNRTAPITIEPHCFLEKCLGFIDLLTKADQKRMALSLGWRVDCRSFGGYTLHDIEAMKEIIEQYNLVNRNCGLVLAVNARVLAKDLAPFDAILKEYPGIQLLIWTGSGEPPISNFQLSKIQEHFQWCEEKIGFDCQVASTFASGMFWDNVVTFVGLFWNASNVFKP